MNGKGFDAAGLPKKKLNEVKMSVVMEKHLSFGPLKGKILKRQHGATV